MRRKRSPLAPNQSVSSAVTRSEIPPPLERTLKTAIRFCFSKPAAPGPSRKAPASFRLADSRLDFA